MIYRDIHQKSILPKSFITAAMAVSIIFSFFILFIEKTELISWLQLYATACIFSRKILLFVCFFIYFIRLMTTLFVFYQRKMYWIEAIIIMNLMPVIIPYVAYLGGNNMQQMGFIEIVGITLFILGSCLNTGSEYLRHDWKKKKENKGHLYTGGLFKYAIHINYFGDITLFTGITFIANKLILLIIPGSMALIFVLILIPLKENYLKGKYGDEFHIYKAKTKRLVPFVY